MVRTTSVMAVDDLCSITTLSTFLSSSFDYLIIGGGTAGLVLASRLTEDPCIQVGVVEAGRSRFGDANIDSPARLTNTLHNPDYDWTYHSTPQVH